MPSHISVPQTAPQTSPTNLFALFNQSLHKVTSLSTNRNHSVFTCLIPFILALPRVPLSSITITFPYFLANFSTISKVASVEQPSTTIRRFTITFLKTEFRHFSRTLSLFLVSRTTSTGCVFTNEAPISSLLSLFPSRRVL